MGTQTLHNRLQTENSAYLKAHMKDLVNWHAYGPAAILKAKDENKPIFLSIGYTASRLCQQMGDESFSRPTIAKILNEDFIPILVDREEFPDVDSYYQQACQLYSNHVAHPISAFLLPDMKPFYAGSYFPPSSTEEMTSFEDLISELSRAYREENEQVKKNAEQVYQSIKKGLMPKDRVEYQGHFPAPMSVLQAIKKYQDNESGGYGDTPKYPHFAFFEWAVEQMLEGMVEKESGQHIIKSIERMLMGGLFDQARGGIHRFSLDKEWMIPLFEKSLPDQAGLLRLLTKTSLVYPSPVIFDSLISTMEYLEIEMLGDNNYFFSGQGGASEGIDGLYHSFTEEEFEVAINNQDNDENKLSEKLEIAKKYFNITPEGNFHSKLNVIGLDHHLGKELFTSEGWDLVRNVKRALLQERKKRIPPVTDPKGVASWNFMIMSALVDVMQYCQIDVIKKMASALFNKILEGQYHHFIIAKDEQTMQLRHSTTAPAFPYAEDYVFFAEAQLRTYEITGNSVFKDNLLQTLKFIFSEFLNGDHLFIRGKSVDELNPLPNHKISAFDYGTKSPAATLVNIIKRSAVLFKDGELLEKIAMLKEELIHESLKNPLNAGEALRALSYPDELYRIITVPIQWQKNDKFVNFIPYFLSRFVINFHHDNDEHWNIDNISNCELQGDGLENFITTLRPPNESPQEEQ